ncbi:MAG: hypothetical protein KDA29_07075 [Phycisphaerales bacterium]|nr:hypothetical protein [Phycisphaerales bacterium]
MAELIIGISGLLLVALTMLQTARIHRQSTDAQIFLECTARFNALTGFHELLANDRLAEPYQKSPAMDGIVSSYFELLSQEYHLNREKILRDNVWQLWQNDIRMIVDTPLMREAWHQTVHPRYAHHKRFCQYVEGLMTVGG